MKSVLAAFAAVCALAQQPASTIGEQRTIAVPVTFSDTPATCPFTAADLRTTVFGDNPAQLSGFYRAVTAGRVWLTGDVPECVTLPTSLYVCGGSALPNVNTAVERILIARGYNMDLYNRRILALSSFPCPWAGIGSLGAGNTTPGGTSYSVLWARCGYNPYNSLTPVACPLAHEFGHNLGMTHAWCEGVVDEYCDNTDTMGRASAAGFNAPHWRQMGWSTPRSISASGTYTVGLLDQTGDMLYLPGYNYYLALRSNGAYLHRDGVQNTLLVDTTKATSYPYDAAFVKGQTFVSGDLYITLLEQSATAAAFSIQMGGTAPPPPPPLPPPPTSVPVVTPSTAIVQWHQSIMFTADQPVTWSVSGYGGLVSPLPRSVIYSASGNPKGGRATLTATNAAGQSATVTITVPKR
jgi:hypothetical protein